MPDGLDRVVNPDLRRQLEHIRQLYGDVASSAVLQASVQGFQSQRGIYKPAGSEHALWIRQTKRGNYPDKDPQDHPDGSWTYRYSPEAREGRIDLELPTNKGLLRCQQDRIPVGVFRQVETSRTEPSYEVLGLAFVEGFDGTYFILRGEPIDWTRDPEPEALIPTFVPFDQDPGRFEAVPRVLRVRRFATVIRRIYHEKCCLCSVGYRLRGSVLGLEAAHIIPVERNGNLSDVRNGVLLCRNHHALFDGLAWTIDEDLRVVVSEDDEFRRSAAANHIMSWEGKKLPNLPTLIEDYPAEDAIRWRMTEFRSFGPAAPTPQ